MSKVRAFTRLFSLWLSLGISCNSSHKNQLLPPIATNEIDSNPRAGDAANPSLKPDAPIVKPNRAASFFTNPIQDTGADPWVVQHAGGYVRSYSDGDTSIWVTSFATIDTMRSEKAVLVWTSPPGTNYSRAIWAPEVHHIGDRWYIYFAATEGNNDNHRMFVIESEGDDPQGRYHYKGMLAPPTDRWAIDGTVLTLDDGRRYFIWSGWDGFTDIQQNLYIAPMINPWTLASLKANALRYEAERAVLNQAQVRSSAAASGGSAVGFIDFAESYLDFQVSVPSAATYLIDIHYSNGTGEPSSHQVSVDGVVRRTQTYPSTTSWENWQTVSLTIDLRAGANSIRLAKGKGFAEVDYIEIKGKDSDRVVIGTPNSPWERQGQPINEGPQVLKRKDKTYLIFSASGGWTDDYNLGLLALRGSDPMNPDSWTEIGQAFSKTNEVFGPGHCSFTQSLDGQEDWIVYHAAKAKGSGWDRNIRAQKFEWDAADQPQFGTPAPPGLRLRSPALPAEVP